MLPSVRESSLSIDGRSTDTKSGDSMSVWDLCTAAVLVIHGVHLHQRSSVQQSQLNTHTVSYLYSDVSRNLMAFGVMWSAMRHKVCPLGRSGLSSAAQHVWCPGARDNKLQATCESWNNGIICLSFTGAMRSWSVMRSSLLARYFQQDCLLPGMMQ